MGKNVVGWFEIPVTNMDRPIRFYEQVFGLKLTRQQVGSEDMALVPLVGNRIRISGLAGM